VSTTGDRVNPVAVKEFRQAVQSRWVMAVLMLFLLINLGVVGGYLMLTPDAATSINGGRNIFMFLLGILLITCMGFVPAYTAVRLSLERNDANIDLLFVTTITPGAIVRGKYFTAMALTLLIFSACMPFMILTYLLRGIDLPTIFFVLAFEFVACAAANAMGIFAGSVSGSWLLRGLVDAGAIFILFYMAIITIGMAESALMFGTGMLGGRSAWWTSIGMYLLVEALAIGLLYVLSVAMLSPRLSNRMLVPRLYITAGLVVTGIVMLVWSYAATTFWPVTFWMVGSGIALTILTVTALGERDTWSARVRRRIPRNALLRWVAFLLYTGSAGGIIWCVLLFTATMLAALAWSRLMAGVSGGAELGEACGNMTIVFGYILCYCLTTAFARITLLRSAPTVNLSVIAALLGTAVWMVPYLIAFFTERNWDYVVSWYLLGSPLVLTMRNEPAKNAAGFVVIGWLALCVLLSAPWVIGQWRRFVPYEVAGPAQST
jgi:hypothetical protein